MKSSNRYAKAYKASRNGAKAEFSTVPPSVKKTMETLQMYLRMLERAFVESDELGVKEITAKIIGRAQYLEGSCNALVASAKRSGEWSRNGAKSTHSSDNAVSKKIATLVREGYDQKQAAAIAYDMKRRGEL